MSFVERHGTAVAVAVFLVVALAGILARPLLPVDETRYLAVAWEMRVGGHWLVPRLNGEIYSHKPPLLFWLVNLVWTITGVSIDRRTAYASSLGSTATRRCQSRSRSSAPSASSSATGTWPWEGLRLSATAGPGASLPASSGPSRLPPPPSPSRSPAFRRWGR